MLKTTQHNRLRELRYTLLLLQWGSVQDGFCSHRGWRPLQLQLQLSHHYITFLFPSSYSPPTRWSCCCWCCGH